MSELRLQTELRLRKHEKNTILHGGFPKLGGTILGVPIIRTIVFWVLYWGPLILGNYYMVQKLARRW